MNRLYYGFDLLDRILKSLSHIDDLLCHIRMICLPTRLSWGGKG